MRIVFWQNSLSPHQLPYITQLIKNENVNQVIIAVPYTISESRKNMGWSIESIPESSNFKVLVNPDKQTIDSLLKEDQENSYHLFSGIRGFQFVFDVFQQSLKYNIKRGIITECPYTFGFGLKNGKPLWLHRLRFLIQDKKYIPCISYVFAIGENAAKYYHSISHKWKVFQFAYCTKSENNDKKKTDLDVPSIARFSFLGSLSQRKAPIHILKALHLNIKKEKKFLYNIDFIGDGKLLTQLKQYTNKKQLRNIHFLGYKTNNEAISILKSEDILILPSIHDGWGAVINEALTKGLYVICSDACGAKDLLSNPLCGQVFKAGDYKELAKILLFCSQNIEEIRSYRDFRKNWAINHISGQVIANYMIDCLSNKNTKAPWLLQ